MLTCFNGTNGFRPFAGLSPYSEGSFIGTARQGHSRLYEHIRVTTNGNLTPLYSFNRTPAFHRFQKSSRAVTVTCTGTTGYSYVNSNLTYGTVYKLTTNGVLTTLAFLNGTNGLHPFTGLTLASDGYLYGAMADAER